VKILVMQGEDASAEVTELLGEFVLSGLRPGKAGEIEIEVKFDINADGIVSVSAKDTETDLEQMITVMASSTLSDVEVELMIEENEEYTQQVKGMEAVESERSKAVSAIESIERMLPIVKPTLESSEFGRDALSKATGILERSKALSSSQDLSALRTVNDSLSRTLNMFTSVASRLSAG
jgi:molecular chaperone DnaK